VNALEQLKDDLTATFPAWKLQLDAAAHPAGSWFLDVTDGEQGLVVDWRPGGTFGITSLPCEGFGCGADETYETREETAARIKHLFETRTRTQSPP
jgi:hypothetical protein